MTVRVRCLCLSLLVLALLLPAPGAAAGTFPDVPGDVAYADAVRELAARGIIRGYPDGRFGPDDPVLRAQAAALVARALGWDAEDHPAPFLDQGATDPALWRNVGTLAFRGVARGYPDGAYDPGGPVARAQVISLITRAMVAAGAWIPASADDSALYPDVPAASGHRLDLATYASYTGGIPGRPAREAWPEWATAASRAWFAQALWPAIAHVAPVNASGRGGKPGPTPTPTATAAPQPTPVPSAVPPRLLFGVGPEADGALASRLVAEAPVRLLTSWYNGPGDLAWMTGWRNDLVPQSYANGYALHLIVYSGQPQTNLATPYGPACGQAYPLSARFADDMRQLAETFRGTGTLYVTMFTEFQTYACTNNQWVGNENYWRALKDQYMTSLAIFHQYAPNARVSLGWGGWQARWDDPANGGGRSLFPYFADVLRASDFQSFQAMQSDSNVTDVRDMTRILGAYGPVMLAHYRPDSGSATVAGADLRAMLTDSYLADVTRLGLFAWSFMDANIIASSETQYQFVKATVTRYATP